MEQLVSYAAATFLALFPIANPLGVVPAFYSLTRTSTPKARSRQARQIAINSVAILAVFLIAGQLVLNFFGISLGVLQIAGGFVLGQTALDMVSARWEEGPSAGVTSRSSRDITLIPMAVPIVSGPGAIGMVIGLIAKDPRPVNYAGSLIGIAGLGLTLYACLKLGEPAVRLLGKEGVAAFTRILGFFILAIAVQFFVDGASALVLDYGLL